MNTSRSSFVAFGIAWLVAASGALAGFKCPAKGGPQWREYRSAHFEIFSDSAESTVERIVVQLESMHALEVQALVGEQVEIPGRLRAIAFDNARLYSELAGEPAGYYKPWTLGEPTIVFPSQAADVRPQTIAHEVAHHVSHFFFVRQPVWFAEGIAEFLETVAIVQRAELTTGSHLVRGRNQNGIVGAVPDLIGLILEVAPRVTFRQLIDWKMGHDPLAGSYHLYSWLLYHWLWNTRSKDLSAYQQRLSNGEDPLEAWRATFADLDPANASAAAKVDDALDVYRRSGRYLTYRVQAKADTSVRTVGPMASADVHMLVAEAALAWGDKEKVANVDEALAEDPSQPVAIVARSRLDKSSPVERLRKSVAVRPSDWRAWSMLGAALPEEAKEEKEAALRKAVSLNPDRATAQNNLAWFLVNQGRAKEALPIANRALDLAPGDWNVIDTLAVVAARLGKCKEALILERRAASMVVPETEPGLTFRKRIGEYESQCGTPVPAAASAGPVH